MARDVPPNNHVDDTALSLHPIGGLVGGPGLFQTVDSATADGDSAPVDGSDISFGNTPSSQVVVGVDARCLLYFSDTGDVHCDLPPFLSQLIITYSVEVAFEVFATHEAYAEYPDEDGWRKLKVFCQRHGMFFKKMEGWDSPSSKCQLFVCFNDATKTHFLGKTSAPIFVPDRQMGQLNPDDLQVFFDRVNPNVPYGLALDLDNTLCGSETNYFNQLRLDPHVIRFIRRLLDDQHQIQLIFLTARVDPLEAMKELCSFRDTYWNMFLVRELGRADEEQDFYQRKDNLKAILDLQQALKLASEQVGATSSIVSEFNRIFPKSLRGVGYTRVYLFDIEEDGSFTYRSDQSLKGHYLDSLAEELKVPYMVLVDDSPHQLDSVLKPHLRIECYRRPGMSDEMYAEFCNEIMRFGQSVVSSPTFTVT